MWKGIIWAVVTIGGIVFFALGTAWREFEKTYIKPLEAKIQAKLAHRTELVRDRDEAHWEARLFDRDLPSDLNEAVTIVRASHEEMRPLKENKAELRDDQKQVADKLSNWHYDAGPGLFQKSNNIPQSSFLGSLGLAQTLDQRDGLKRQRDKIGAQIVTTKNDLDHIYATKLNPAKEARDDAWRGLERMKVMRRDGVLQQHCRDRAAKLQLAINACDVCVVDLRAIIVSETARFKAEGAAAKAAAKAAKIAAKEARQANKRV